ncbi:MAG: transposase [Candidatus Omnitrophica bacterium]|nr:transposase [Candidatus Omnitrophota bacterium]MCB9782928.1 transposase [Candidatus Omnitrophota bacterium]
MTTRGVKDAYSEAQFKTLKYCPLFPKTFGALQDARSFCQDFVTWYSTRHRHSGIALLTPKPFTTAWHNRPPKIARPPWTMPTTPIRNASSRNRHASSHSPKPPGSTSPWTRTPHSRSYTKCATPLSQNCLQLPDLSLRYPMQWEEVGR